VSSSDSYFDSTPAWPTQMRPYCGPPTNKAPHAPAAHAPTAAQYACGVSRSPDAAIASSVSTAVRQRPESSEACRMDMKVAGVRSQARAIISSRRDQAASTSWSLWWCGSGWQVSAQLRGSSRGWKADRQAGRCTQLSTTQPPCRAPDTPTLTCSTQR